LLQRDPSLGCTKAEFDSIFTREILEKKQIVIPILAWRNEGVVIGGDFNTNHDQAMFAAERTLDSLANAGYQNGFEGNSPRQ
jgi:hypothetical protein